MSSFATADAYKTLKKRADRMAKAGHWYEAVTIYERLQEIEDKKPTARKLEQARAEAARMKTAEVGDQLGQWQIATVGELTTRSQLDAVQSLVDQGLNYSRSNQELLDYETALQAARAALLAREKQLAQEVATALAAGDYDSALQHLQSLTAIDPGSEILMVRRQEYKTQVNGYCKQQLVDAENQLDLAAAVQSSQRCVNLTGKAGSWSDIADFYGKLTQAGDLSAAGDGEAAFQAVKSLKEAAGASLIYTSVGGAVTWRHAEEQQNDIGLYRQYLELFPEGEHSPVARDCVDWAEAEVEGTSATFTDYLTRHPTGRFRTHASRNLELLGTRKRADRKTAALLQTATEVFAAHGKQLLAGTFCRGVQSTSCGFDIDDEHPLVVHFGESELGLGDDTFTYKGQDIPMRYSAWADGLSTTVADRSGIMGSPGVAVRMDNIVHQITSGSVYYDAVLKPGGVDVRCLRGGVKSTGKPSQATIQQGTECEVGGTAYRYEDGHWQQPTELPRIFDSVKP
jgi:tetratricopeptide (TPR) repeat protein